MKNLRVYTSIVLRILAGGTTLLILAHAAYQSGKRFHEEQEATSVSESTQEVDRKVLVKNQRSEENAH